MGYPHQVDRVLIAFYSPLAVASQQSSFIETGADAWNVLPQ
jgi:hypothetical protein